MVLTLEARKKRSNLERIERINHPTQLGSHSWQRPINVASSSWWSLSDKWSITGVRSRCTEIQWIAQEKEIRGGENARSDDDVNSANIDRIERGNCENLADDLVGRRGQLIIPISVDTHSPIAQRFNATADLWPTASTVVVVEVDLIVGCWVETAIVIGLHTMVLQLLLINWWCKWKRVITYRHFCIN